MSSPSTDEEDDAPRNKMQCLPRKHATAKGDAVTDFTKMDDTFHSILQHADVSSDSVSHLRVLGLLCKSSKAVVDNIFDASPEEGSDEHPKSVPTWLVSLHARAALVTDRQVEQKLRGYNSADNVNEADDAVIRLRENRTIMSGFALLQNMYTEEHVVQTIFKHLLVNIVRMLAAIQDGIDEGIVAPNTDLLSLCVKATRCHIHNSDVFKNGCSIMVAVHRHNGWYDKHTPAAMSMLIEGFNHHRDISVASYVMCKIIEHEGGYTPVIGSMGGTTVLHHKKFTTAVCGIMHHCMRNKDTMGTGHVLREERAKLIDAACKVMGVVWSCGAPEYCRSRVFEKSMHTFDHVVMRFERPEINDSILLSVAHMLESMSNVDYETNLQAVQILLSTDLVDHLCQYWTGTLTRGNDLTMLSIVRDIMHCGVEVPDHSRMVRHCIMRALAVSQSSMRQFEFHRSETFVAETLGILLRDAYERPEENMQKVAVKQGVLTICIAMIGEMEHPRRSRDGSVANVDQKKTRLWVDLLSLAVENSRKYQTRLVDMDGLELLHKLVHTGKGTETTPLELSACTLMSRLVLENYETVYRSIFRRGVGQVARAVLCATSRTSGVTMAQAKLCVQTLDFLCGKSNLEHDLTLRSLLTMANLLKTHCLQDTDDARSLQKGILAYLFKIVRKDPHHTQYRIADFQRCIFIFRWHPALADDSEYQVHLNAIKSHMDPV